jgi:hypothetical protein
MLTSVNEIYKNATTCLIGNTLHSLSREGLYRQREMKKTEPPLLAATSKGGEHKVTDDG